MSNTSRYSLLDLEDRDDDGLAEDSGRGTVDRYTSTPGVNRSQAAMSVLERIDFDDPRSPERAPMGQSTSASATENVTWRKGNRKRTEKPKRMAMKPGKFDGNSSLE